MRSDPSPFAAAPSRFARPRVSFVIAWLGTLSFALLAVDAPPACAADADQNVPEASTAPVPAGEYRLDPAHSNITFRVDHLGLTRYVGRFTRFDARLRFDPARPRASLVDVRIEAASLDADNAPAGFLDTLRGESWLDAAKHPDITFRSARVESAGNGRLRVVGDFTLRGITRPLVLDAKYNGGYAGHPMDPNARIGFSATGTLRRSDFGISFGIPAPGSTLGVGDEVEVLIEAEFTGPPLTSAN